MKLVEQSRNFKLKLVAGILGAVLALMFMVGGLGFRFGVSTARDEVVALRTENEDVIRGREVAREQRDEARDEAFVCTRSLDAAVQEMHEKGDVLNSVRNAAKNGTDEDLERALEWVEQWYVEREDSQDRVDKRIADCLDR